MNILLVAQNLQIGGVQIALVNLLKVLSTNQEYNIDLLVFGDGPLLSDIPESVQVIKGETALRLAATPFQEVKKKKNRLALVHRFYLMGKVRMTGSERFYDTLFKKQVPLGYYDVAISYFNDVSHSYFNQGTNQFTADYVKAGKKLAWIHTDPILAGFDEEYCRNRYAPFDELVCVSEACANKLKAFLPEYSGKISTVYNVFPIDEIQMKAQWPLTYPQLPAAVQLITVTRIDNGSKNLKRICEVCDRLEKEGITNYVWQIIGDGPDLEKNRKDIQSAGLSERVIYTGSTLNPYPHIKKSDLFVLTSNFEGYPMVVQEALILGIPVLTTPYAAASEQVTDGLNGMISEMTSHSLYDHVKELLTHPSKLEEMKTYINQHPVTNDVALNQLSKVFETIKV